MLDIESLKSKIKEKIIGRESYHKTSVLLMAIEEIQELINNNFPIAEQVEILADSGIEISTISYRKFLKKHIADYDNFLTRNGWSRAKSTTQKGGVKPIEKKEEVRTGAKESTDKKYNDSIAQVPEDNDGELKPIEHGGELKKSKKKWS